MNFLTRIALVLTLAVITTACGASTSVQSTGDAGNNAEAPQAGLEGESCNGVESLRTGLPLFDYDRAETLEELVAAVDVVLSGTLDSAVWSPIDGADPGEGSIAITPSEYGALTPASPEISQAVEFEIFAIGDDGDPHPLIDPLVFPAQTQFIAFADVDPADPNLLQLHPQGLYLRCESSDPTADSTIEAILEPLPADASTLSFFELVDTVSAVAPPKPPRPVGDVIEVPHRVLADGLGTGEPWSTQVVTDAETLAVITPDVDADAVDFESGVVFALNPAESGSCPFGPIEGLEFDTLNRVLYPVVSLAGDFEACTADANPHLILVVVAKADLPEAPFDVWVNGQEPPSGVVDGVSTYLGTE